MIFLKFVPSPLLVNQDLFSECPSCLLGLSHSTHGNWPRESEALCVCVASALRHGGGAPGPGRRSLDVVRPAGTEVQSPGAGCLIHLFPHLLLPSVKEVLPQNPGGFWRETVFSSCILHN